MNVFPIRLLTPCLGSQVRADDLLLVHTGVMVVPQFVQVVSVFSTGHGRVQLEVQYWDGGTAPVLGPPQTIWLEDSQQVVVSR